MNRSRKLLTAGGAVAAIALAVPAFAQDSGDTTTAEPTEAPAEDRAAAQDAKRAEAEAAFAEALAAELGLPTDDVADAVTTVRERMREEKQAEMLANLATRLDEAVANGRLTQAEADDVLARAEAGEFPHRGRRGGHGPGRTGPRGDHDHTAPRGAPDEDGAASEGSSA